MAAELLTPELLAAELLAAKLLTAKLLTPELLTTELLAAELLAAELLTTELLAAELLATLLALLAELTAVIPRSTCVLTERAARHVGVATHRPEPAVRWLLRLQYAQERQDGEEG